MLSAGRMVGGFSACTPGSNCPAGLAAGVYALNLSAAAGLAGAALGDITPRGWPGVHHPAPLELFTPPGAGGAAAGGGFDPGTPQMLAQYPNRDMLGIPSAAGGVHKPWINGTALSGSIFTVSTVLSWICAGMHSRRALPSPVCA